jgi:hypothetical protein
VCCYSNHHLNYNQKLVIKQVSDRFLIFSFFCFNVLQRFAFSLHLKLNSYFSERETGELKRFVGFRPISCIRPVSSLGLASTTWNDGFLDPLKAIAQQGIYLS